MRLEGVLNLGHQKLPRQVAGTEGRVMRFRGEDEVSAWDSWVARRMTAQTWERVVCSMISGGLCGAGFVGWRMRGDDYHDLTTSCRLRKAAFCSEPG